MALKKKPTVKKTNTLSLKTNKVKDVEKTIDLKPTEKIRVTKTKPIVKKPTVKKPMVEEVEKNIPKIVKPIFVEKLPERIEYFWDIENLEISDKNIITKIFFQYKGVGVNYKTARETSCSGVLETKFDPTSKIETSDYKYLEKGDILSYIQSYISLRQVQEMKSIIINELSDSKKITNPF